MDVHSCHQPPLAAFHLVADPSRFIAHLHGIGDRVIYWATVRFWSRLCKNVFERARCSKQDWKSRFYAKSTSADVPINFRWNVDARTSILTKRFYTLWADCCLSDGRLPATCCLSPPSILAGSVSCSSSRAYVHSAIRTVKVSR